MTRIYLGWAGVALALMLARPAGAVDLAVMPAKMLDTSGEQADSRAAHAARLAALGSALTRDLAGRYDRTFEISATALNESCPDSDPACLLQLAESAGADVALFPSVIKTSSLIMRLYVQVVDVSAGTVVQKRDLNFRGDTDESWRRAEQFLVQNLDRD